MERAELFKLKAEIEADLAAVNRLLSKTEREKQVAAAIEAHLPRKSGYQVAEDIIKNFKGEFSVPTIYFEIRRQTGKVRGAHTSAIISQVINKLRHRNPPEIEIVVDGKGSRSGVYRYKSPVRE
jgi:hypothetical protein